MPHDARREKDAFKLEVDGEKDDHADKLLRGIQHGHGGSDQGAVLPNKMLEKDITLAMARRLKAELEDHGIAARLVRDADVGLSLEQRAEMANGQHAGAYVAIHAGLPGHGVRIYTPAIASAAEPAGICAAGAGYQH